MLCFRSAFIVLALLLSYTFIFADEDLPASMIPWYTLERLESPYHDEQQYADTTHTGFQLYDFFIPGDPFVAGKGNVGHAARSLRFSTVLSPEFALFNADPYQHYRFMHEYLRFYRPPHVFTDLFYVMGTSKEQLFYGMHTQRFAERMYASGNYRLVNSPGLYSRMGARNSNVYLTFDFRNPDERYQLLASFVSNRFEHGESGGLKNHVAFNENPVRDSVFMYQAMSYYRETAFHLNHFYRTGFFTAPSARNNEEDDAAEIVKAEPHFVSLGRINHNFSYTRRAFVFDEKTAPVNFYATPPASQGSTFDSTMVHVMDNQISWSNFPMEQEGTAFPFNFRLALTHRYVNIQQPAFTDSADDQDGENGYQLSKVTFNQLIPSVSIESDRSRYLSFDGLARITLGGYNDEDMDLGGNIYFGRSGERNRLRASAFFYLKEAPYFLTQFSGNYISWDEDFEKMNVLRLSGTWFHQLYKIETSYYLLNNMVFLNAAALPEQNTNAFSVFNASIAINPGIGILQSRHEVLLQYATSDQYERVPPLVSYHSLFFDFSMFDRALLVQTGVDLTYNAPYKPMAYMPVVRQFYAQDEFTTGNIFLADIFLTAKIKRTRFLLRLQNIAGLLPGSPPVYSIPFYPLPEASIKFGVSWMFFN